MILMLVICLALPMIMATPTYQQNTVVNLFVPCTNNGTACSASVTCNGTIINPIGTLLINNEAMTRNISTYNITLIGAQTSVLGEYQFTVTCCDGTDCAAEDLTFIITSTGFPETYNIWLVMVLFVISSLLLVFATATSNSTFGFASGTLFILTGLFLMVYGLANIADMYTRGLAIVVIAIGIYIFFVAAYSFTNKEEYDSY